MLRNSQTQEKPLAISSQVTGNACRTVIPAIQNCRACVQRFCGPAVRAIGFRKADGISGPAQKNNPKAVVLIERARRIKFDDVTVTDFAMRQASASSRRRGAHLISVSGDSADEDGQAERAGDPARLRWQ